MRHYVIYSTLMLRNLIRGKYRYIDLKIVLFVIIGNLFNALNATINV